MSIPWRIFPYTEVFQWKNLVKHRRFAGYFLIIHLWSSNSITSDLRQKYFHVSFFVFWAKNSTSVVDELLRRSNWTIVTSKSEAKPLISLMVPFHWCFDNLVCFFWYNSGPFFCLRSKCRIRTINEWLGNNRRTACVLPNFSIETLQCKENAYSSNLNLVRSFV